MQSELPFFESPEDALRAAVQALGGSKKVGPLLWPDKSVDTASRLLLDCINPGRNEKLEITQIMRILLLAKDAGFHGAFNWLAGECGYESKPISREEEEDRLVTVIEQATNTLAAAIPALQKIKDRRTV